MKNTKDAIRYGIETLGVTPDEMFSLIESSKGYDGEDYRRWLANQIIEIAEKDGVGYSQLLVKKFNIIQDMVSTKELAMKKEWIDYINNEGLLSVDFADAGTPIGEDIDWLSGIDYDKENSFFLQEELPNVYNDIVSGNDVSIIATLSDTGAKKNSELYSDASQRGLICKNLGSLFLYRMCNIVEAFDITDNFTLKLFAEVDFLLDKENEQIWKYFLQYFSYTGYVIQSSDLYEGAIGSKRFAYLICKPRVENEAIDSIILTQAKMVDGEIEKGKKYRFTRSDINFESYLLNSIKGVKQEILQEDMNGITGGKVMNIMDKNTLGYLNIGNTQGIWLSTYPAGGITESIPITKNNLKNVIVYYSVAYSLKSFGINEPIKVPLSGSGEFENLFCNCIPLFLYGLNTRFRGYDGVGVSSFDLVGSPLVDSLLSKGEIYYSFEAKELIDLCKGYSEFLVNNCSDSITCKCFNDLRLEADYADFNSLYLNKVRNLCSFIKNLYKEVA